MHGWRERGAIVLETIATAASLLLRSQPERNVSYPPSENPNTYTYTRRGSLFSLAVSWSISELMVAMFGAS